MKRHLTLLACLVLVVAMVCSLASCDLIDKITGKPSEEHTHSYVDGKCECGESDPNYVAPHTHNFVEGKCECGETDPNYVPEVPECTEHAFGAPEVTKEATCTEAGEKKLTCSVCGHSETLEIAPNGHTEETVAGKAPTCTEAGLSNGKKCSVCGEVLVAQAEIAATGHTFVEGSCACGEIDPDYNGPKTYVLDVQSMAPVAQKDKADGESAVFADFFTIYYSAKFKLDGSNKTFEDGFEATQRLNWGGGTVIGETTKNAIMFNVNGTATVKVWWVCGGTYDVKDGDVVVETLPRQVGIYDAEGNLVAQTNVDETSVPEGDSDGIKNNLFISELTISEAGTYYLGNVGNSNYFFKVEVVVTPIEEVETEGSINVETTDTYTMYDFDSFTFAATTEGYYTFKIPAGLGAMVDGSNAPEVDYYMDENGGEFTVGLEAGQEIVVWVSSTTRGTWTIDWSLEAGDVENQPDTPIEGDATELVVGSNNLVFADGELSQGKTYPFTVTEEGTYTFRSDLMAVVMDADGNTLGRGQVSLTPGTYSVTLFSMMPMPSNSFIVNITFEAPATGEPDGSEQYPFVWETLPESVTFESDNMNMVYYVFTATADGSVTFTWAVEGNDWFNYFELVEGATTENNGSGFAKTSHTFVVEAGKTYRVGLGTWNEGGETVVSIAFNACAHVWSEATCTTPATCSSCGATTGGLADHTSSGEATCQNPEVCTVCGFEMSTVDHTWGEPTDIVNPDCSTMTDGSQKLTCTVCGHEEIETLWAYHSLEETIVNATCTENGSYHAVCTVCGYEENNVIEAQGHYNYYATCGETTNCMECGVEFTLEHDTSFSPATCTEPAYCMNCWQYVGEPAGHTYTYPCDKVCAVCYELTNENATHTIVAVDAKAATCTENGNIAYWYCSDCGQAWLDEACTLNTNLKSVVSPALGHDYVYGICSVCQAKDAAYVDYYLVGYINGADYGCEGDYANLGEYKFVDGKLTVKFNNDSYIFVKSGNLNGENVKWYLFETYHDASKTEGTLIENKSEKMFIPGGVEVNFTLVVNEDGSLTVSYHIHSYEAVVTAPTCTAAGYTTHTCSCGASYTDSEVAALGHADENGDYKCDACSTKMLPADGTALTIAQAIAVAKVAGSSYSSSKYYITGIVTNVYNTTYGNLYLKDDEGNQLCIYGLYTWDKAIRYDKMEYKPVEGDELTVYTVLGTYNSTAQGKDAWIDEVVAHEHNYVPVVTAPTCVADGFTTHTCSICKASYTDSKVDALGHTTDNGVCDNCGLTIGGDAPVIGEIAKFEFGANGSAAHVDGNDYGTSKSFTSGSQTLSLTGMSKVFGPAYDAKGNSCIKLGTSKVTGSFTFTVGEDVTEVVIYVAGYKAATSTNVKVNGVQYTVKTASNNGEYTAIVIDTTTTKTITFTSVTYRCMIDSIVFNGVVA